MGCDVESFIYRIHYVAVFLSIGPLADVAVLHMSALGNQGVFADGAVAFDDSVRADICPLAQVVDGLGVESGEGRGKVLLEFVHVFDELAGE